MKKLIYILLILALTNCNTSKKAKPCTSCPHFSYINYDTTVLVIPHYNYNGMCFPEFKTMITTEEEIVIEQLNY